MSACRRPVHAPPQDGCDQGQHHGCSDLDLALVQVVDGDHGDAVAVLAEGRRQARESDQRRYRNTCDGDDGDCREARAAEPAPVACTL